MKVTAVNCYLVPESVSRDSWCHGSPWLLIKVDTDAGISGWGEAYVQHDWEQSTLQMVQALSRYLEGLDPFRIKYFKTMAYEQFAEFQTGISLFSAISGIELALWDVVGKALDTPVYNLLGGACRERIPVYANCWSHRARSAQELAQYAKSQVDLGFKAVKIYPFLYSHHIEEGIACLGAVREAIGPDVDLFVDAWRSADIANISQISSALRANKVSWFEDPIAPDNIDLIKQIRHSAQLPLVTGESLCTKQEFRPFLENGVVDILNPDICSCGLLEIKELAAMAEPYYAKVSLHNYNSMALGLAAGVQAAALVPNFASLEFFQRFVSPSMGFAQHKYQVEEDGCIAIGQEAGLGVEIDEAALQAMQWEPAQLRPWPKQID